MIHQLAAYAVAFAHEVRDWSRRRGRDGGSSTEEIVVFAFLVVLAVAAIVGIVILHILPAVAKSLFGAS
jgi:hypothetical protein